MQHYETGDRISSPFDHASNAEGVNVHFSYEQTAAGKSVLLPTAPGDRITVVSEDGGRSVLVQEEIDERSEIGDFIAQ